MNSDDFSQIAAEKGEKQQNRKFLHILCRKGEEACALVLDYFEREKQQRKLSLRKARERMPVLATEQNGQFGMQTPTGWLQSVVSQPLTPSVSSVSGPQLTGGDGRGYPLCQAKPHSHVHRTADMPAAFGKSPEVGNATHPIAEMILQYFALNGRSPPDPANGGSHFKTPYPSLKASRHLQCSKDSASCDMSSHQSNRRGEHVSLPAGELGLSSSLLYMTCCSCNCALCQ